MAASMGYLRNGTIRILYGAKCYFVVNKNLDSATPPAAAAPGTSSSPVVFKVQSILRLSVAEHPMNEFLEEKDWQPIRESSSLDLPWSRDEGLIVGDDDDDGDGDDLKISETLTLLGVSKTSHQFIIHTLRQETAAISHLAANLALKMVVHIFEVTHITLPLIDEEGQAIYPERKDYGGQVYTYVGDPLQTKEEDIRQAKYVDCVKKLIVGARDVNEEDEDALIQDWFCKLTNAINRVAWQVTEEDEAKEASEEEEEKEANEEEKEEEQERICPICSKISEPDEAWTEMPCCYQAFHCDCLSPWIKRLKNCPQCGSSLPLVLQSARGFVERHDSEYIFYPSPPGLHDLLVVLWHLLSESVWWTSEVVHEVGCMCGCRTNNFEVVRA